MTAMAHVIPLVLMIFPIQLLWMVLSVGWFLLVSSVVKSTPALWAVGVPLIASLVIGNADAIFKLNFESFYFISLALGRGHDPKFMVNAELYD